VNLSVTDTTAKKHPLASSYLCTPQDSRGKGCGIRYVGCAMLMSKIAATMKVIRDVPDCKVYYRAGTGTGTG